jgi:hypothetical protein
VADPSSRRSVIFPKRSLPSRRPPRGSVLPLALAHRALVPLDAEPLEIGPDRLLPAGTFASTSVSSMRSRNQSPKSRFATALSALPTWSDPVGLGAKRTRFMKLNLHSASPLSANRRPFLTRVVTRAKSRFLGLFAGNPKGVQQEGGLMKRLTTLFVASLLLALAVTQSAATKNPRGHHHRGHHQQHAVFVQTNEPAGNRIIVFDRARNGQLSQAGTYPTGGNGGVAAPGDEPDHLASQGSLVYDWRHSLLIAVNAGSDTVSTFKVRGDRLRLTGVVPSGGAFPASVAVSGKPRLRPELGRAGDAPGVRHPRAPAPRAQRLDHVARALQHRPAELPDVTGSGRVHARRQQADRHDEGERKPDRRLSRARRRTPLEPSREHLGHTCAVRVHVRAGRPARLR